VRTRCMSLARSSRSFARPAARFERSRARSLRPAGPDQSSSRGDPRAAPTARVNSSPPAPPRSISRGPTVRTSNAGLGCRSSRLEERSCGRAEPRSISPSTTTRVPDGCSSSRATRGLADVGGWHPGLCGRRRAPQRDDERDESGARAHDPH
jgi:hypothetical protein